jgi:hypothetical protein
VKSRISIMVASAALAAALTAPGAFANDQDVIMAGRCSAASSSKIKLSPDDGLIEVEFEVDQNRVGDTWNVTLRDNGAVVFRTKATTAAPSGSFEVRRRIPDRAGRDTVRGIASNPRTGENCVASATI